MFKPLQLSPNAVQFHSGDSTKSEPAILKSEKPSTTSKAKDPLQSELQTLVLLQCCQQSTLPILLLLTTYIHKPFKAQQLISTVTVASLQRCYNPLASGFLSPFPGLQPWHFTREYQVCDLSHRRVEMSAGLSLVAIKWVSHKIKRIFVINTIKTDFKNIINTYL